jgi:hypothetical protein
MDDLFSLHPDTVFLRREALEHGYDDPDIVQALRAGVITRIRHGAYAPTGVWTAADEVGKHLLRAHAVLRSHQSALALSHTTAAAAHGLRLFRPDLSRVHVLCLETPLGKVTKDVCYHVLDERRRPEIMEVQGFTAVPPAHAALQAASLTDVTAGVVILDSVVDLELVDLEGLHRTFADHYLGMSGGRKLHITVRLTRKGSNSVGETLGRVLMFRAHLPEPELQFEVYDASGQLVGQTDYAWPEYGLLGEFDGLQKYGRLVRPGETAADAVVREKIREDRLRELTGWLMIRLIWSELFTPGRTADRIQDQLRRGRRLLAA